MVDIITKIKFKIAAGICNLKGKKNEERKKQTKTRKGKKSMKWGATIKQLLWGKKRVHSIIDLV